LNSVPSIFAIKREDVIKAIKQGIRFATQLGAEVSIFTLSGKEFIKTEGNATESDNLGELPRF